MDIQLKTLLLTRYDKEKHEQLKNAFETGESKSNFIHQIGERLELSTNKQYIYQSAFVIEDLNTPVGYLFISNMLNDEVFLEYSILKDFRQQGYASTTLLETTEYLFENHNLKSIRLDIEPSNHNSIRVAEKCGYELDEEDYESKNYTGKMQFVKDNQYYISKRRK